MAVGCAQPKAVQHPASQKHPQRKHAGIARPYLERGNVWTFCWWDRPAGI